MSEPKFKVGQVVVMKGSKKQLPWRILDIEHTEDGWFYAWNRKNYAAESMIRTLTAEEFGSTPVASSACVSGGSLCPWLNKNGISAMRRGS